jgi:hypothetical protein
VPVYRGADALAAQISNGLQSGGLGAAAVAVLGAVLSGVWAINGWWLGRRNDLKVSTAMLRESKVTTS